jgi:hypothetical protein
MKKGIRTMNDTSRRRLIAGVALGLAAFGAARADDDRLMPRSIPAAYTQECAACHVAYPPALLPASSWQRIMGGLDRHFGTDASLDAATASQIGAWLQAHAGRDRRAREVPPQDRITRSAWFERKHREIDAAVWKHASVKSPANCAACHAGAERGHYDDDTLKIPAGLEAHLRRPWSD